MNDPKVVAYLLDDGTWVNRFEGEGSEREHDAAELIVRQLSREDAIREYIAAMRSLHPDPVLSRRLDDMESKLDRGEL